MKKLVKAATAAVLSLGALAIMASSASAYVACNREGECWHVKNRYTYHPEFGVVIHSDGWRWRRHDHYVWREHEGRGYWRNGVWITF